MTLCRFFTNTYQMNVVSYSQVIQTKMIMLTHSMKGSFDPQALYIPFIGQLKQFDQELLKC